MQKFPEASDWKRGDACAKKGPSWQKKEACSISAVISRVTTPKFIWWKALCVCL